MSSVVLFTNLGSLTQLMPGLETDLLIAFGVYAALIVLTLQWVHRAPQESVARPAKLYSGITLPIVFFITVFASALACEG